MKTNKLIIQLIKHTLILFLCFGFFNAKVHSANIDTSASSSTTSGAYHFKLLDLPTLDPMNSTTPPSYSYLWWMGDNGFSFDVDPEYHFQKDPPRDSVEVTAITLSNYGSGGSPPITLKFPPMRTTNDPINNLPEGQNLHVQHFRNAVIDDTTYLIISYAVPGFLTSDYYSGDIIIDLPQNTTILEDFMAANESFTPNNEDYNEADHSWSFENLPRGREWSILVPIKIETNEEEKLEFNVRFQLDTTNLEILSGLSYYTMDIPVLESHDPNQMLAYPSQELTCDYGGKPIDYTVIFENVGDGPTNYVKVVCHLDPNLDMSSISQIEPPIIYPNSTHINFIEEELIGYDYTNANINVNTRLAQINGFPLQSASSNSQNNYQHQNILGIYDIDRINNTISFEFHGLMLYSPMQSQCANLDDTRDQFSFRINTKPGFQFGPEIVSHAVIEFDDNKPITTDKAIIKCKEEEPITKDCDCVEILLKKLKDNTLIITSGVLLLLVLLLGLLRRRKNKS